MTLIFPAPLREGGQEGEGGGDRGEGRDAGCIAPRDDCDAGSYISHYSPTHYPSVDVSLANKRPS